MKIAIVSMCQIWENKEENFEQCKRSLKIASKNSTDLIIFPEMTLTGFSINIDLIAEDEDNSDTIRKFSKLALAYNIAILFGVVIKSDEKAFNKSLFISPKGEILGQYSKMHPFSFLGEERYFKSGEDLEIVQYQGFKIGLSICYDLRFPELYSCMAREVDMIVNIANWPKKRVDHWNTLLKARAIENQLFLVGVNRVGKDGNGLEYESSSNIYNANGDVLESKILEEIKIFDIDKNYTKQFREKFNTINDRKIEIYKKLMR